MAWTYELLRRLKDADVDFLIVGGVAAIVHGSARVTEDLDVFAPLDQSLAVRIIQVFQDVRPRWRMRPDFPIITPDSPHLVNIKNMYLRTDIGQLDVLGELPGVGTFDKLLPRATDVPFGGIVCPVIDLESLLKAKRIAG